MNDPLASIGAVVFMLCVALLNLVLLGGAVAVVLGVAVWVLRYMDVLMVWWF